MLQFTDLVHGGESVRDIKQRFPETALVFEQFGLRTSCDECSIEMAARKVATSIAGLLLTVLIRWARLWTPSRRCSYGGSFSSPVRTVFRPWFASAGAWLLKSSRPLQVYYPGTI
jgi:hypothetical protein